MGSVWYTHGRFSDIKSARSIPASGGLIPSQAVLLRSHTGGNHAIQHQGQNNENGADPLGGLGQLGVNGRAFPLDI